MAEIQRVLDEGNKILSQMKIDIDGGSLSQASTKLTQLKILMTKLPGLPPCTTDSSTSKKEREFARGVLEQAVLLSTRDEGKSGFPRHLAQLKPYYFGALHRELPASPLRLPVLGLHLLFLLTENRLAEFHSELELLAEEERADPHVRFPIELDQFLAVGSYDQVLEAKASVPHPYYSYFMDSIVDAVREAVAECTAAAYETLALASAATLLRLNGASAAAAFAQGREWDVRGGTIYFPRPETSKRASDIPSMRLISESLLYATELERIV
eukprot:CAMPEP_0113935482 /NCGR_PEP_ID=MMETSP1339-20121228/2631_1 /TAXON_ID=94617 /ORGANISM="Fibrocapsa japonica" /LENGTH=269 /DNA_ID=CAMNT_0000937655 /DNA_START=79 /DNA_END=888 /DNA_ORIENTATION=+ /assembly_acc=CAM_ASM_000762